MIRYALVCEAGHDFESWFSSSHGFDDQKRQGFVTCPVCATADVRKAIMAPAVTTRRAAQPDEAASEKAETPAPAVDEPAPPQPVALLDEKQRAMRAMIQAMHRKLAETSVDVGPRFPAEARRLHEEGAEGSIRGHATPDEARALLEDGIPILPVPILPDERH